MNGTRNMSNLLTHSQNEQSEMRKRDFNPSLKVLSSLLSNLSLPAVTVNHRLFAGKLPLFIYQGLKIRKYECLINSHAVKVHRSELHVMAHVNFVFVCDIATNMSGISCSFQIPSLCQLLIWFIKRNYPTPSKVPQNLAC